MPTAIGVFLKPLFAVCFARNVIEKPTTILARPKKRELYRKVPKGARPSAGAENTRASTVGLDGGNIVRSHKIAAWDYISTEIRCCDIVCQPLYAE